MQSNSKSAYLYFSIYDFYLNNILEPKKSVKIFLNLIHDSYLDSYLPIQLLLNLMLDIKNVYVYYKILKI